MARCRQSRLRRLVALGGSNTLTCFQDEVVQLSRVDAVAQHQHLSHGIGEHLGEQGLALALAHVLSPSGAALGRRGLTATRLHIYTDKGNMIFPPAQ
jgi:hypothetical protein